MREAAFEIARQSDDFAPSIAHEVFAALSARYAHLVDAWKLAKLHRMLDQLDDRQLNDIGVTRAEIHHHTGHTETAADTMARLQDDMRNSGWLCAGR